jgi:hypothetical protein
MRYSYEINKIINRCDILINLYIIENDKLRMAKRSIIYKSDNSKNSITILF